MIDRLTVDKIYAAADVVEVVSDFISLRKKGVNYQACCPFHNEKTPSFVVSPTKGLFKCFGCGKGGNAVTFVMEHEGMSYPEALKHVAKKYGIEVKERELSAEEKNKNDDRESMFVVSSYAAEWFANQIDSTDEGRSVGLSYFKQRGFKDDTIQKFGLGYCPNGGDVFTTAAMEAGYKEEFLVSTGLSGARERGGHYDRFVGRVIFPIHSVSGRVLGFGGRTLRTDKNVAKYLNSPESEIYHKSNILYGLYFAKKAITQLDSCILVEGYTDVISMHQTGVENVVASSGTALTTEQIRLIGRFTKNITVIFDGDAAGVSASLRGVDMILREGMNVRVVALPKDEDPDSFAKKHNATELREYIAANELDFISFKTRVLMDESGDDPIKRGEVIMDIVASIAEIPDPIMRSLYIKQTAKSMDMEGHILASEVARKRISHGSDRETREFIRNQQQQQQQQQQKVAPIVVKVGATGSSMEQLEKELVKYLMLYGHRNFEYKEGKTIVELNVAGIIINDLETNGLTFKNREYRALYDSYVEACRERDERANSSTKELDRYGEEVADEGNDNTTESNEIDVHRFINHPDPEVCNEAVNILTHNDNYIVSKMWQKFDVVVESEVDRLGETVPRTVMLYKSKAIESIIRELHGRLTKEDLSEQEVQSVIQQISILNQELVSISKKLTRLIF